MTQEHAMPKVEKDSYEQLRRQLRELEDYARNSAFPEGNPHSKGTDFALRSVANTLSQLAARLSGVAAVPEGWKLVPIEPTPAMKAEGDSAVCVARNEWEPYEGDWDPHPDTIMALAAYSAMLAAAPEPHNA